MRRLARLLALALLLLSTPRSSAPQEFFPDPFNQPSSIRRPLTVNVTGNGTVTGTGGVNCTVGACSRIYNSGATVTLTATPGSGVAFAGWSGACTGTGTCVVSMTAAQSVTAVFANGSINLAWAHDGLNLVGFSLERRSPCNAGTFGVIASPGLAARSYTDATQAGASYDYRLQAVGSVNSSAYTPIICTAPTDVGGPVVGTPTVGPTTTTYPITWAPSLAIPNGTPVALYQYNGGYVESAVYGSTTTNSLNMVLPNKSVDDNAYICVQGQDQNATLSITPICQGWFVPAAIPSIQAASCQQADVAAAIASAPDGSTVSIPAGQCTIANGTAWTQNLQINKRINLVGAGDGTGSTVGCGSCATVIQDNRDMTQTGCCLFQHVQIFEWTIPNTGVSSMSGIKWMGSGLYRPAGPTSQGDSPTNGIIRLIGDGSVKSFRMHHVTIVPRGGCNGDFSSCQTTAGMMVLNLMGLLDHVYFDLIPGFQGGAGLYVQMPQYHGQGWYGDNSFALADTFGTDEALYIENSSFISLPSAGFQFGADGWMGNRVVYRNNTFKNTTLGNHGTDSGGRERGQRHIEAYNNTIIAENGAVIDGWTSARGGTGVFFNNAATLQGTGFIAKIADVGVFRATEDSSKWAAPWGKCDGTSPWDQNNVGGHGYACIDQAGRGVGDYLGGADTPVCPAPNSPQCWPHQAVDAVYGWNNTINGSPSLLTIAGSYLFQSSIIQEDRDFFNCVVGQTKPGCDGSSNGTTIFPKPGYVPLGTHPLTLGP